MKAPQVKEVPHKVEGLQEQLRQLQKENAELKEKAAAAAAGDIFKDVKEVNGHRYIASQVSVSDAGALRTFADNWKQKDYSDLLVLVAAIGDKVNVLVASKTKAFMQETLSKNWHQSSMDVVVVNQTWPWQEEATKLRSKNCWMQ